jgi:hypothetical protein
MGTQLSKFKIKEEYKLHFNNIDQNISRSSKEILENNKNKSKKIKLIY